MGALEFQASQVISRLEEAVEKGTETGGSTWNNPSGFLSHPKCPEEILGLIQVNIIKGSHYWVIIGQQHKFSIVIGSFL